MSARLYSIVNPMTPSLGMLAVEALAGSTLAEALVQSGLKLKPTSVLLRPGAIGDRPADILIPRREWDGLRVNDGTEYVFVAMPQGGKSGSQIAAAIATIALYIYAPYLGSAASKYLVSSGYMSSAYAGIAAKVVTSVILVGGSMLISSLMPGVASYNTSSDVSPTYNLNSSQNNARLGQAIPEVFGTHKLTLDLAMQSYREYTDNEETVYMLFCAGIGYYTIEKLRAGSSVIGTTTDGVFSVSESYSEVEVEIVPPGDAVTLFPDNVATSSDVSNIEVLAPNEEDYTYAGPYIASGAGQLAYAIGVDIEFPYGLFTIDDNSRTQEQSVTFEISLLKIDSDGNPLITSQSITRTVEMASRQAVRKTYYIELNSPGRYRVTVLRTSNRNFDNNAADTMMWTGLRAYLPITSIYDGVTMIAIKARATSNLNGSSLNSVNTIQTRKIPVYDAETKTFGDNTETRMPGPPICYMARSVAGLADSRIALDQLAALDATFTTRGDYFDGVFDQQKSLWECMQSVLQVGRTAPVMAGSMLSFIRDEKKTVPTMTFSPRNIVSDSFSIDYTMDGGDDTPDALLAKFIDNRTWDENTVLAKLDGSDATEDDATELEWFGITDREHAWRETMYRLADSYYRRRSVNLKTAREGLVCIKGSLTKVCHWLPSWGASADVIACEADDEGYLYTLSQPWSVPDGESGTPVIGITSPDGRLYGPVTFDLIDDGTNTGRAQVRLTDTATIIGKYAGTHPYEWPVWSGAGLQKERPRAMIGVGDQVIQDALVVSMKPESNGRRTTVALKIDDDRVYAADTGEVPEEVNSPTDTTGENLVIDGIDITQSTGSTYYLATFVASGADDAVAFEYRWKKRTADDYSDIIKSDSGTFANQQMVAIGNEQAIDLEFRACGSNGSYGPWYDDAFYCDGSTTQQVPAAVMAVTTNIDWSTGSKGTWSWPTVNRAVQYKITVQRKRKSTSDWVEARELKQTGLTYSYYAADEADDGGPWARLRIGVTALADGGRASSIVYSSTSPS